MADSSKAKTVHVARVSIENFFLRHKTVYFLTFSEPGRVQGEALWTKDEAEEHFKPFRDYCSRRGLELLVVWQLQDRGSWHPHCLVDGRIDVNFMRPWMVARGWGPQMKFKWVTKKVTRTWSDRGEPVTTTSFPEMPGLCRYLTRYLTRSFAGASVMKHKRCFGGSAAAKAGGNSFRWVPWIKPGAMLYAAGLSIFVAMNGGVSLAPRKLFRETSLIIRLGVEVTGWAEIDPWWDFGFPKPPLSYRSQVAARYDFPAPWPPVPKQARAQVIA